jgi:hypothetical protein
MEQNKMTTEEAGIRSVPQPPRQYVADRLRPQPSGADGVSLAERPLDTFAEAAVGERQCERQNERQQTEHAADHDTDTFGLNLSAARSSAGNQLHAPASGQPTAARQKR